MDTKAEQKKDHAKNSSAAYVFSLSKSASKKLLISGVIFIVLLILIVFVQKPQSIIQQAAGTPIASNSAGTTNCSPVPFYCLILPGSRNPSCSRPRVCPTQPPPPGFVAQTAPPKPATNSATPASGSATRACLPTPASLGKLIIHFDLDTATTKGYVIRAVDMPALNNYAAALKQYPNATVTIVGYTDSVPYAPGTPGPINTNQALSVARAQAAENYLKSKGATKNTYVIQGKGATNFVAPNNPQTGNILNRRVEITTNVNPQKCTTPTPAQKLTCTDNNGNWGYGGYTFTPPANANQVSISSQWNVVATTCKPNAHGFSIWPGIQTNNLEVQAGTYDYCAPVNYTAWTEAYPRPLVTLPKQDVVKPGDNMYTSITMTSKGRFTTVVKNATRGWQYTVTTVDTGFTSIVSGPYRQTGILLEDEGTQTAQLAPFNPANINFNNSQFSINGSIPAYLATAPGLACTNIVRNNTILDQVSNITGGNFTQTWKHL